MEDEPVERRQGWHDCFYVSFGRGRERGEEQRGRPGGEESDAEEENEAREAEEEERSASSLPDRHLRSNPERRGKRTAAIPIPIRAGLASPLQ